MSNDNNEKENKKNKQNHLDEKVGYKNPPKHTQFKKGQSGNPHGRPKKTTPSRVARRNAYETFLEVADMPINITLDGKVMGVNMIQAVYVVMFKKALSGDFRTLRFLTEFWENSWKNEDQLKIDLIEATIDMGGQDVRDKMLGEMFLQNTSEEQDETLKAEIANIWKHVQRKSDDEKS